MKQSNNQTIDSWLTSQEFIWCPGCPMIWLTMILSNQFQQWNLDKNKTWMVSGIGCTGRIANYFGCHSVHTTHGRAVPVAEGIKTVNSDNQVFVVSGDGDLLSIGLSHLIHAARRNSPLKVICVNNSIYAMTGGQSSPATPADLKTKTYPSGTPYSALPTAKLLKSFENVYYQQVNAFDSEQFKKALNELHNHSGFGFLEVISVCVTNDPRVRKADEKQKIIRQILSSKCNSKL